MTPQAERKDLGTSADSGTHRYYISSKYNISSRQGSAAITTRPPHPRASSLNVLLRKPSKYLACRGVYCRDGARSGNI